MHFLKLPPKCISQRVLKKIENERFMISLQSTLNSQNIDYIRILTNFLTSVTRDLITMHLGKKVCTWK